jgi:hypothetical protein
MAEAHQRLAQVLREARALLARPENDFAWSSWKDAPEALAEMDRLIASLDAGIAPSRLGMSVLFMVTGPIQEVSLSSGWAQEFLEVASRFDKAVERV